MKKSLSNLGKILIRLPWPELLLAAALAVAEYFGQRKAGVNHHLKARRMQFLSGPFQNGRLFFWLALLALVLCFLYRFLRKKSQTPKKQKNCGLTWGEGCFLFDSGLLAALLLGFLRKSLLSWAYLVWALCLLLVLRLPVLIVTSIRGRAASEIKAKTPE